MVSSENAGAARKARQRLKDAATVEKNAAAKAHLPPL